MIKNKIPQLIAGAAAAFGAFCLGTSIGWSAPTQKKIISGDYGFGVSSLEFSWVSSLMTLGAALMCIPVGFLISIFGRKPTMLALAIPYVISWLLLIFAKNVIMLYIGRFFNGMCGGSFSVLVAIYTTEIAEISVRGILGTFYQLLTVFGVLYAFVVGPYVSLMAFNIACGVLPIVFFIVFIFMPESPVYYVQKGKLEKAEKSLKRLRGKDHDITTNLEQIEARVKRTEKKVKLTEAFRRRIVLKGLLIAVMLQLFQQFTGIKAIIFYSTNVFRQSGASLSPSLSTIIGGIIMCAATFSSLFLIDRTGRRILLLLSGAFMAVSTASLGLYFFLKERNEDNVKSLGWLPVTSVCLFYIFYSIGFGPIPWCVMAEVFTEDIKGLAGSIAGTANWLAAFVVTNTFPPINDAIGPAYAFWIFTVIAVLSVVFVIIFVPETKGKTLQEVQILLEGKKATAE